jgi:hypothetical protein
LQDFVNAHARAYQEKIDYSTLFITFSIREWTNPVVLILSTTQYTRGKCLVKHSFYHKLPIFLFEASCKLLSSPNQIPESNPIIINSKAHKKNLDSTPVGAALINSPYSAQSSSNKGR